MVATPGIAHEYGQPFVGKDNSRRSPDFTIKDADTGTTWFWEHLGMLGDAEYEQKWNLKLAWYAENGSSCA